jgi:acyl dehydratase
MPSTKLHFEDVQEGESVPPATVVETVDRTDWVIYAGASGDFNPMHTNEAAAKAAGLPSVFGHGMFSAGVLATALTERFGIGSLTRYRVRFTRQVWPGEALIAAHKVVRKHSEGGKHLVDLECSLVTQKNEVLIAGEATVALPSRTGA